MQKSKVNFEFPQMSNAVKAFVRERAIRLGSFIAYEENGVLIKENPRTGQKTVVQPTQNHSAQKS